ncbi:MAG TPA: (d)CMP kinase [Balneolaceae bacterium]|nr:(d)CMP kinase [Balneolaceae bacterium]
MIIVIDGPAGSGKSTTAKAVAKKLNIEYLDSGALYRAMTWVFLQTNQDKDAFLNALDRTSVSFFYDYDNEIFHVFVNGNDITGELRSELVSDMVSRVASFPQVRSFVNALMQKSVINGKYIAEGRDLGTAVFPDADLKFFMKADQKERARRRFKELKSAGNDVSFNDVRRNITKRDQKDMNRERDPLKKAADAIEINTTDMTFETQVRYICDIICEKTVLTCAP